MPQLTIDLTDDDFAKLTQRARYRDLTPEEDARQAVQKSLNGYLRRTVEGEHSLHTAVTSIKGFVSTLLLDEDGTMFAHSDRLEFLEIVDKECDRLKLLLGTVEKRPQRGLRFQPEWVILRDLLQAAQEQAEPLRQEANQRNNSRQKRLTRAPQLVWSLAENLPQLLHTDGRLFLQALLQVIHSLLEWTPEGETLEITVTEEADHILQVSLTTRGVFIDSAGREFFQQHIEKPVKNAVYMGAPFLHLARLFVQWHGGSWNLVAGDQEEPATITYTLRRFDDSFVALENDQRYQEAMVMLRTIALQLLSDSEGLSPEHLHFTTTARAELAHAVNTQLRQLEAFLSSLETTHAQNND
ncbi:hypothetical protein [Armatimonas rosea]|uniref:K+-sensing histidine kinase KdpD n=1 Tax=Armatimonas rosea TaxID=685828 RepID=A0A7W9W872_ARMRO|nr:hypothetical protein [Armatimonas rosea]MBB6051840.1 K+-sensing histidine kinase KdpD [Armatimonas rosea]